MGGVGAKTMGVTPAKPHSLAYKYGNWIKQEKAILEYYPKYRLQ